MLACGSPGREEECAFAALFVGVWWQTPSTEQGGLSGSRTHTQKLSARLRLLTHAGAAAKTVLYPDKSQAHSSAFDR